MDIREAEAWIYSSGYILHEEIIIGIDESERISILESGKSTDGFNRCVIIIDRIILEVIVIVCSVCGCREDGDEK